MSQAIVSVASLPDTALCDATPQSCCPSGSTLMQLTEGSDVFQTTTANSCVLALGGSDTISDVTAGNSALFLGSGDDTAMAGPGALTVR
ncbi:MAG TPA: hypothetical protein VGM44_00900, partial [Polyangiaceae bacterium]